MNKVHFQLNDQEICYLQIDNKSQLSILLTFCSVKNQCLSFNLQLKETKQSKQN